LIRCWREFNNDFDLTAGWHNGSFARMAKCAGNRDSRVTGVTQRLLTAAVGPLLLVVLAACSDSLPLAPVAGRVVNEPLPAAARYIVEMASPGPIPAKLASAVQAAGGRILHAHQGMGIFLVAGLSAKAATALRSQVGVRTVLPDLSMRWIRNEPMARWVSRVQPARAKGPGQSRFTPMWGVNPRTAVLFMQGYQWNMTQTQADTAWQITNQGAGTRVFILDSGVDTAHQDLVGLVNTAQSTSFAFAPTDTFDTGAALPFSHDVVGHGTFVSSIIASNSIGVGAVAPQSKLTMVRVLDDDGVGSQFAVVSGILYATDSLANVINMSIGGYFARDSSDQLAFVDFFQRVVDYAFQRGTLVVAAAGNESVDWNAAQAYFGNSPGSYVDSLEVPAGLHHVMSIGATGPVFQTNFDQIAEYSNYGKAGVGVFAPGGNVLTDIQKDFIPGACSSASICTGIEDGYVWEAGTSFASPMVAGEAAVVRANSGGVVNGQVLETCLLNTATKVTGVRPDSLYNFGRIDVLNAVKSSTCL
jgi:hypothetical protein